MGHNLHPGACHTQHLGRLIGQPPPTGRTGCLALLARLSTAAAERGLYEARVGPDWHLPAPGRGPSDFRVYASGPAPLGPPGPLRTSLDRQVALLKTQERLAPCWVEMFLIARGGPAVTGAPGCRRFGGLCRESVPID